MICTDRQDAKQIVVCLIREFLGYINTVYVVVSFI